MSTTVIKHLIIAFLSLFALGNCTIPEYIHVCRHDVPDLGACIKESIEALRPRLTSGIPELEVPSVEPFTIERMNFSTSAGDTYVKTNLTDVQVYGGSDFKILKIIPIMKKKAYTFQFELLMPHLHLEGQYEIDSKILALQLQGKGPFKANTENFHVVCILRGKKVQLDGKTHLEFEKMKCSCKLGKTNINLENLFDGNALLGEATNAIVNDNIHIFYEEIKPNLSGALSDKFTKIANKITLHFDYDELFP